jgi:hypothetical protein
MSALVEWLRAPRAVADTPLPAAPDGEPPPLGLADLAEWDDARAAAAAAALRRAPTALDPLLLRLHFRRGDRDARFRAGASAFCHLAYRCTSDVRYFNELLWFDGARTPWRDSAFAAFSRNLDLDGRHSYPQPVEVVADAPRPDGAVGARGLTIGLLGDPHRFRDLAVRLEARGHRVRAVSIRSGARRWRRAILEAPVVGALATRALGWRGPYVRLRESVRSQGVARELAPLALDLAVHKLELIIRPGLIAGCGRGILNDHWGPLPWVRGRSSVEFSLLHGLPIGGTVHFVDEGVDTGPIVGSWFYDLAELGGTTAAALRNAVAVRADERIAAAIDRVTATDFATVPNPRHLGLRYYTMAPELVSDEDAPRPRWFAARRAAPVRAA